MSSDEEIFCSGDMDLAHLMALIGPVVTGVPVATESGIVYGDGIWAISDAELTDDWYDDDGGLPLSRYRFTIYVSGPNRYRLAKAAFDRLVHGTGLDLLWLSDLQVIQARRPALVSVA